MKLRYFDVERFGVWNNARLDGLENGLTVIYGPNGSGKTTLMQFVRAVLYGRPAVGSARFLPSVHAGSQGGRIGVTQQDREYVVNRFWETDHGHDEATITRPDGTIHDTVAFRQLLGEVDEDVFNYLFTVGYREAEDFELIVREALADTGSTGLATEEVVRVDQAIAKVDQFADRLADLERERVRLRQEISRLIAMQADPP
ncbi:MAG: AAA family ATPase, partial [Planctomycetaceae bacterium]